MFIMKAKPRYSQGKSGQEALLAGFMRYYNIIDGVITGNTEINDTYDGLIVYGVIPERLEDKFIEYENW